MSKISYNKLKLKLNTSVKEIEVNEQKIEVLQYLPIEDKYNLIMLALQNSKLEGIYNPIKLDMYIDLYTIYMYTNLNFTESQREDESKLYDTLKSNDVIKLVKNAIPYNEIEELSYYEDVIRQRLEQHDKSISGVINNIIESLPKNAEAMQEIIDNFDQEKFKNVLDFAKAANGGNTPN